jgi:hypothetical protein
MIDDLEKQLMDDGQQTEEHLPRTWPTLDPKALYGLAGKVVELATRSSEADPAAILATFLARVASEFGANPVMFIGDSEHYARINTVIVGNSSKARKGTSEKPIRRIFAHRGCDYTLARISPGPLSSGEGLVYAVRDKVEEWKLVDKNNNSMGYVVTDPGITDKRLCVIDEEFAAALSCTKREGNTLSTIIRQFWDYGNIEPLTKSNRIKATGAHVCIVTHITNVELQQKMHETEALNGFGNRFLWICARRQGLVPRPQTMPDHEVDVLHRQIIEIVRTAQSEGFNNIQFTDETWSLWGKVYPELSQDHQGFAGVIINRAEAQVIRLSMIYALLDEQNTVEPHHLDAALAFWQYCQDSALFIFGGRESDIIADKIVEALCERDQSLTEIHTLFQHHVSAKRRNKALQDLTSSGKVTIYKKTNDQGRPTIMCTLVKTSTLNSNTCAKSAISVLSTSTTTSEGLNAHNALNAQDVSSKISTTEIEVEI